MSAERYFDYNATTRVSPRAAAAVADALNCYANPSAAYLPAQASKALLARARKNVAKLICAEPEQVFFTSGGTEANNWALNSAVRMMRDGTRRASQTVSTTRIVTTAIEHDAILATARALTSELGGECHEVRPATHGAISTRNMQIALDQGASLVAVMLANNETGVIQPAREIAQLATHAGAFVHIDAVQAAGKMPIDVQQLGCDSLSLSAHKFHGPKGVGALYLRRPECIGSWLHGGGQEGGKRSGTENTPGIAGMGEAAEEALAALEEFTARASRLKALLLDALRARDVAFDVNGGDAKHGVETLPNTLNLSFREQRAEALAAFLTMRHDISVSVGSACGNNKSRRHSHVLAAMGLPEERLAGAMRLTFGRYTRKSDMLTLADALASGVRHLGGVAAAV